MLDKHINVKSIKEELKPSGCEFQQDCCPYQCELIHHPSHNTADVYRLDISPDSAYSEDNFVPQIDPVATSCHTDNDKYLPIQN